MNTLNAVCFCVLMDHHQQQGVENAHPNYIKEKLEQFERCTETDAITFLDNSNQRRVRNWCKRWNYPIPEELEYWMNL